MIFGGDLIGVGGYGCVFSPIYKYTRILHGRANKQFGTQKYVGKLLTRDDASKEIEEGHGVLKLDPRNEFTIVPVAVTNLDPVYRDPKQSLCPMFRPERLFENGGRSNLVQLISINGGPSLHALFKQPVDQWPKMDVLIKSFEKIFKGLKTLIDNDLIHNDIKDDNICFDASIGQSRLIDFGAMTRPYHVVHHEYILNYTYPTYPIEYKYIGYRLGKGSLPTQADLAQDVRMATYWAMRRLPHGEYERLSKTTINSFVEEMASILRKESGNVLNTKVVDVIDQMVRRDDPNFPGFIASMKDEILRYEKKDTGEVIEDMTENIFKYADVYAMCIVVINICTNYAGSFVKFPERLLKKEANKKAITRLFAQACKFCVEKRGREKMLDDMIASLGKIRI